ncbi:coiled-coil domain-containing protein 42 like-2 isoform X2 [Hippocampus comes]|uniref:coiled-coil domain-containing protein 42 like-2 isoform X2 n=1 Tax=Hippocampus comes TaxID=109280 RepID=UPI00094F276B|nr:PREDICTED: cilia- and flagella-associated protein 73 isoform X2 [Hippocampus comes]
MSGGERCAGTARRYRDRNDTFIEIMEARQEQEHLVAIQEQCLQEHDAAQMVKRAELERKEANKKEVEVKILQEEYTQLQRRKHHLLHRVQRDAVYRDFMQQALKLTRFEDEASLAGHLENLLRIREQLCEKQRLAEEQVDMQRKALLTFNSQHRLMLLQCSNQLSQLHHKLDRAQPEMEHWETKWKHIQGTAAKETLLLGLIKMAALNLYELTGGDVDGEKGVPLSDTDTQLDKLKMFMQDHKDIVRLYQGSSHRNDEEKNTLTLTQH